MTESLQIVVADDDPVLSALLRMKLEAEGHRVTLVSDGDEALDVATSDPPELLVLDVVMPGLDGLEVTRRLRERPETRSLPIVLLTGRRTEHDVAAGWMSGASGYITKPLVIDHLRTFIRTMQDGVEPDDQWGDSFL
jgi:two-component system, OmpR family, phosphate regulon response regulator PhoB